MAISGQARTVQREALGNAGIAHQKSHWNQARVIHGVSIGGDDDARIECSALSENCKAGLGRAVKGKESEVATEGG